MESFEDHEFPPVTELSKRQRRVMGVLVEKAFTTPEYYPLTLKAVATGCNQKSNRAPVSNYSEDDAEQTLEQLRQLGLVSVVHTDGGRAVRYRHWMRKRFTLTEAQLAILTELMLRGRQSLGELRSRSSRMVPIESLDQLRAELTGLQEMNLVQASGDLQRRGVEVDHALYPDREGMQITATPIAAGNSEPSASTRSTEPVASAPAPSNGRLEKLEQTVAELYAQNQQMAAEVAALREAFQQLEVNLDLLRTELGG